MVERLRRQRRGLRGRAPGGSRDTDAHLDEAVEATAVAPGSLKTVGRERGAHEPRVRAGERVIVEPQPLERARAVPDDEHVGAGHEREKHRFSLDGTQVEGGAAFADRHVRQQRGHLCEAGWIDAQHVGPVRREETRASRAREHACEVEDADACEGPGDRRRCERGLGSQASDDLDRDGRLVSRRAARGRGEPAGRVEHPCRTAALRHHRRLERLRFPGGDRLGDPRAIGAFAQAEGPERGSSMGRVVGMEPEIAVAREVVARYRIPNGRALPPDRLVQGLAPKGGRRFGRAHPHLPRRRARSRGPQLGHGERRHPDRRRREGRHGVARREQVVRANEDEPRDRLRIAPERLPEEPRRERRRIVRHAPSVGWLRPEGKPLQGERICPRCSKGFSTSFVASKLQTPRT